MRCLVRSRVGLPGLLDEPLRLEYRFADVGISGIKHVANAFRPPSCATSAISRACQTHRTTELQGGSKTRRTDYRHRVGRA